MFRRAIAAVVLLLSVSPAFSAEFAGGTFGRAADMAAGKAPASVGYDGASVSPAVRAQVPGAMGPSASSVMPPAAHAAAVREESVPTPVAEVAAAPAFDRRAWTKDLRKAVQGPLAAPLGAALGLLSGLTIAFATSKFLS
jgi:hypothetical protein